MKLKNTSTVPTELAREVLRFVKPSGISKFDVMLKNSEYALVGRAYHAGSSYHATRSPFIVLRIGPQNKYPYKLMGHGGYLDFGWLYNQTEGLVVLAAHELRHLWQAKHKRGYRVWGAKGQFSERDADAYAMRKLREWREQKGIYRAS
jgi:hypothetical protein